MLDSLTIPAPPADAPCWPHLPHQRARDAALELSGMLAAGEFAALSPDTRYRLRRLATEGCELADHLADLHEATRPRTRRERPTWWRRLMGDAA
jgi:hypothetical protein